MTLIHFWNQGLLGRIATGTADVTRATMKLTGTTCPFTGEVLHPAGDIHGVTIRPHRLPSFDPLTTTITIADEPEFAFTPYTINYRVDGLFIYAIPYIEHLRRSVLPDWYTPAQEAAQ